MDAATMDVTPRRDPEVAWVEIDAEVVAYDPRSRRAHLLSETAAILWPLLDGEVTVRELAADVAEVFGVDLSTARAQVAAFVTQLTEAGLLVGEEPRATG